MYKNEHIFEFYLKNNNKKDKKNNEELTEASKKILSCIIALGYESEYPEYQIDIEKVIHMIMFENTEYNMLLTKDKISEILDELRDNKTKEAQIANKCLSLDMFDESDKEQIIKRLYEKYMTLAQTPRLSHIMYLEPYYFFKGYENVLEHIYGTMLLAIGIKSEYNYFLDYKRLYSTLLLHETDEIILGDSLCDLSQKTSELTDESKTAISEVLSELRKEKDYIKQLIEYKRRSDITMEYASLINRLEFLLQTKIYEIRGMYISDEVFDKIYEKDKSSYHLIPCLRGILEKAKKLY